VTKRYFLVGLVLALGGANQSAMAQVPAEKREKPEVQQQAAEKQPSAWMKLKLDYSQKLLAGLTRADFDALVQNAMAMRGLSTIEGFVRSRKPGYSLQLEVFNDANAELIKQAQQENLEGAALAFTQLTISCVNCHKRLREDAKLPAK
jgi:hypothetical protein